MGGYIFKKITCMVTLVAFVVTSVSTSFAQSVALLPAPGSMVALSAAYQPPVLKGIKVYAKDPFRFDFILDKGDNTSAEASFMARDANDDSLTAVSKKLIKYFLASLTIPEKDLWVTY